MKTSQKQPRKARRGFISGAVRALINSGLTGDNLKMALEAVRGKKNVKLVKLPRNVYRSVVEQLSEHQRVVIVNKGPKRFKVYSFEGYITMKAASSENATKHKPWEHSRKNRVEVVSETVAA